MNAGQAWAGRELAELCVRLFGVRPSDEGRLAAFAQTRAREHAVELTDYVARLRADTGEQARLARVATNGWTWFWREVPALAAACERLALLPRRPVHAWVAGCSTGEEAYTLAILAAEARLSISILATDVDQRRIQYARAGRYDKSALRHLPTELIGRYFREEAGGWSPTVSLRSRIRFQTHNLLSRPLPAPTGDWDLVSCRNVLLHTDAWSARRMLANLSSVLDPFGERVLSAADELGLDGSRLARGSTPTLPPPARERVSISAPLPAPAAAPMPPLEQLPTETDRSSTDFVSLLTQGNHDLASHRLEAAERAYEAAEAIEPQSAELSIMLGILHRKAGRLNRAEHVIRRALFLEPDLWLGWILLAGLYEREELPQRARSALETALHALSRRPRLKWRAPDCGISDRRIDPATAKRFCRARLAEGAEATKEQR